LEILELTSTARSAVGKGIARKLRKAGKVPGVLYGPGKAPVLLAVPTLSLERILKKKSAGRSIFNLSIQNGETASRTVMIKELQIDPISKNFIHVDFYEIDMNRKIRIKVPVAIQGKAKGVENGGILQVIQREIEILCLPMEIPNVVDIDVTQLDIGDSIHVKDISLGGHIEIPSDTNFTVVTVVSPKAAEGEAAAATVEGAEEAETDKNGEEEA